MSNTTSTRRLSFFPLSGSDTNLNSSAPSAAEMQNTSIKTGFLFKRGGGKVSSGWKKRFFVLNNQFLLYYKSEKDRKPQGQVGPLKNYVCEDGGDDHRNTHFEFRLVPKQTNDTNHRTYWIYATSAADKADWMSVLQHATSGQNTDRAAVEIEEKLRKGAYDIPPKDLEWSTDLLGKGASGVVKKGIWLKTTEVAVKALNNLPEFTEQQEVTGFYKEIETLSQLRHPNIVPMFGYCKKEGYLCLVTEYVKGGNLSDSIHNLNKKIDLNLMIELCSSICRGMVYLHTKLVIHRDLKPGNILVENLEEGKVKVCDFGLSTITQGKNDNERTQNTYGSPAYAAPELPTPHHTNKVDVFSFGVIMWEIVTRQKVWQNVTHAWKIAELVSKGERLPLPQNNPLNPLIEKCWATEPDQRPTFSDIYAELEQIKSTLPASSLRSSFNSPPPTYYNESPSTIRTSATIAATPVFTASPEARILELFEGRELIAWDDFCKGVVSILKTTLGTVEKLKHILCTDDATIEKSKWLTFMEWFTPLNDGTGNIYISSGEMENAQSLDGYSIEEIADIVGPKWFFGFMDANKAKDLLQNMPIGSFLFRFSSTPRCYTLSCNYAQVGHWRIVATKNGPGYPLFKIDDRTYLSLHDIIAKHGPNSQNPMMIKAATVTTCYLLTPADRTAKQQQSESLYQVF